MVQNKKNAPAQGKKVKLTLILSKFGRKPTHADCAKGLGLRRMHHTVVVEDNACNRGMINKISYMLKIEEV